MNSTLDLLLSNATSKNMTTTDDVHHSSWIANVTTSPVGNPLSYPFHLDVWQKLFLFGYPILSLVVIVVFLRYLWPVRHKPIYTTNSDHMYGAVENGEKKNLIKKPSFVEEGEVAGDYDLHWTKTFDFSFLILMFIALVALVVLTFLYESELFTTPSFWFSQLPKLFTVMAVSLIGGIVCRYFCQVDEKGYIITNKDSKFKVNYTRKLQHFAAYLVPLVYKSQFHGPLAMAWADYFTLIAFFLLIQPIRERLSFFMLQFNALDRPEDRPHTLKWIIIGNIAPGLIILLFFKWLFASNGALTFILVFITGIGDGLAEPIGISFGKHKYKTRGCFSSRSYSRSWEGSACVYMSGIIFPALQYADFDNFTQVILAMLILPPTMAYGEAIAPHTADTPVLMIGCGAILYIIITFF